MTDKPTLLTEEEAQDLMSDGLGYIRYWGTTSDIKWDIPQEYAVTITDNDTKKSKRITVQDIREAAYRLVNEKLCADWVISDLATGDYDAVSADAVIQVAVLGEVVYG